MHNTRESEKGIELRLHDVCVCVCAHVRVRVPARPRGRKREKLNRSLKISIYILLIIISTIRAALPPSTEGGYPAGATSLYPVATGVITPLTL